MAARIQLPPTLLLLASIALLALATPLVRFLARRASLPVGLMSDNVKPDK